MIRFALPSDDVSVIARLIFDTDPLIQFLFGGKENALPKIEYLIKADDNIFSYKNIVVYHPDTQVDIQAIILIYDPKKRDKDKEGKEFQAIFSIFELLGIWFRVLFLKQMEDKSEIDGIYVSNISVDQQLRGKGVGTQLIEFVANWAISKDYSSLWLDVSFENTNAKKLYERKDFIVQSKRKIMFSNKGFFRMRRALNKI